MRIGVAQFYHESNSFSSTSTREVDFRDTSASGPALLDRWRDTNSEIAGVIDAAEESGSTSQPVELVPLTGAWAWPSGPIVDEFYVRFRNDLAQRVASAGLDGLLLSLHGAAITTARADAQADLLAAIRGRVGAALPIVSTLDFHANLSPEVVSALDALVGYRTYPHVDYRERGAQALRLTAELVETGLRPQTGFTQPPMMPVPQRQGTSGNPMAAIMARAREIESAPDVLVANVFGGFAYGDSPSAGLSVAVVSRESHEIAQNYADELAMMAWTSRAEFVPDLLSPRDAVRTAYSHDSGLSVLVDVGDNVGGGTPADGTVLLSELLRVRAERAAVVLCDGKSVRECVQAGVGAEVRLRVGGKTDGWHGAPVAVTGRVRMLFDGEFTNVGPMREGITERQGLTTRVTVGGIDLLLTTRRLPPWNLEQLRAVGIEPTRLRAFVAKSAVAFRAAWEPIADRVIEVNTPGLTSADLSAFPYKHVRRPVFPLDEACAPGRDR
ncbi:M81 family metallopeptidase [Candidatus Poribacteria bacterium]|nr:M81 family metallopeptidase [Candidatus Poribacteria bacterium]